MVGDQRVGKTSLVRSFIQIYTPAGPSQSFNNYHTTVDYQKKPYTLSIWDTAGQEEFDKLRTLSYPQTDVFLICYAIDNLTSFNSAKSKWIKEVRKMKGNVVLVGCKSDTRSNKISNGDTVSEYNGKELARKNGIEYMECSVNENKNVNEVFKKCVEVCVEKKKVRTRWWRRLCCLGPETIE